MHYQHRFHAGNFADVFKHVVLVALLEALSRKDTPWCYLESHAGSGLYDLGADASARTGEWQDGIARLADVSSAPALVQTYRSIVESLNPPQSPLESARQGRRALAQDGHGAVARSAGGFEISQYPGSPCIARALMRAHDRLVLCEKIPAIADELRTHLRGEVRIEFHQRDGYELHGLLPPKEKRGLVLIDPPFEARDEFERMRVLLEKSLARFAGGVYACWYPFKNRHEAQRFVRAVAGLGKPAIDLRFDNGAVREGQMRECGMLIVNPPYQLADVLRPALAWLAKALAQGSAAHFSLDSVAR